MSADAAPNDVRLAGLNLVAVLEGRTPIRRTRHLPHAGIALDALDSQAWIERANPQAGDKEVQCALPRCDLCSGEALEVP
jgi:hypothetical protein